jgi:uncharacterized membrane-anchored protein
MNKVKRILILLNLIILILVFNYSVFKKERILAEGELVLLQLAPVDPRSLMQGDYMDLRYGIAQISDYASVSKRGYCVVRLDSNGIAERVRLQEDRIPLSDGEILIRYSKSNWGSINIGAESYFFEEGQAEKYEAAKYGALRVDKEGNSILVGLYDEELKNID